MLNAVENDAAIAALVATWHRFAGGLLQPYEINRAMCTVYALHPGQIVEPEQRFDAAVELDQGITIQITTEGDDPEPCEELIALTLERLRLARAGLLGLVGEGLKNIVPSVSMTGYRHVEEMWLMWQATMNVTLRWIRRTYA